MRPSRRLRLFAIKVTSDRVIDPNDEGARPRVSHDRHRARIDAQPLEGIEVHTECIREHRLDDVTVADDRKDVGFTHLLIPFADRSHRAHAHRQEGFAVGKCDGARVTLHLLPQWLPGQRCQRLSGPRPVVALGKAFVDHHVAGVRSCCVWMCSAVSRVRSRGDVTMVVKGTAASRRAKAVACS